MGVLVLSGDDDKKVRRWLFGRQRKNSLEPRNYIKEIEDCSGPIFVFGEDRMLKRLQGKRTAIEWN